MALHACVAALLIVTTVSVGGELSKKLCSDPLPHRCLLDPCFIVRTCKNYPEAICYDYKCGKICKPEFHYKGQEVTSLCDADLPATQTPAVPSTSAIPLAGSNPLALGNTIAGNTAFLPQGTTNLASAMMNLGGTTSNAVTGGGGGTGSSPMFDALLANAQSLGLLPNTGTGEAPQVNASSGISGITGTSGTGGTAGTKPSTTAAVAAASSTAAIFDNIFAKPSAASVPDSSGCPKDKPKVTCVVQPCTVTTCPGLSLVTCKNNNCGGCTAEFFMGQMDVTTLCQQRQQLSKLHTDSTAAGPQISKTFAAQAMGVLSTAEGLTPKLDTGSGTGGSAVQTPTLATATAPSAGKTTSTSTECPANKMADCNDSVCRVSSCPNIQSATCKVSSCGGCFPKFYLAGEDVTSLCNNDPLTPQQQPKQQQPQQQQQQLAKLMQQQQQLSKLMQQQPQQQQPQQQLADLMRQQQQLLQRHQQQQQQQQKLQQQQQQQGSRNGLNTRQRRRLPPWYYFMLGDFGMF